MDTSSEIDEKKQKIEKLLSEERINEAPELVDIKNKEILHKIGYLAQKEKDYVMAEKKSNVC